ncbi:hypothetical protein ADUPG1_006078 [Aduncisulcus paluster]|uniref:SWIM-type domain-containing protein n=1 Tax=Aduncisulcus paluster TaxID=2918883 RepID=A0ABQ5KGQ3_9EUKA|nr:hypothetical protein ADUPG1_006078 [Aduncisulcus paluster]
MSPGQSLSALDRKILYSEKQLLAGHVSKSLEVTEVLKYAITEHSDGLKNLHTSFSYRVAVPPEERKKDDEDDEEEEEREEEEEEEDDGEKEGSATEDEKILHHFFWISEIGKKLFSLFPTAISWDTTFKIGRLKQDLHMLCGYLPNYTMYIIACGYMEELTAISFRKFLDFVLDVCGEDPWKKVRTFSTDHSAGECRAMLDFKAAHKFPFKIRLCYFHLSIQHANRQTRQLFDKFKSVLFDNSATDEQMMLATDCLPQPIVAKKTRRKKGKMSTKKVAEERKKYEQRKASRQITIQSQDVGYEDDDQEEDDSEIFVTEYSSFNRWLASFYSSVSPTTRHFIQRIIRLYHDTVPYTADFRPDRAPIIEGLKLFKLWVPTNFMEFNFGLRTTCGSESLKRRIKSDMKVETMKECIVECVNRQLDSYGVLKKECLDDIRPVFRDIKAKERSIIDILGTDECEKVFQNVLSKMEQDWESIFHLRPFLSVEFRNDTYHLFVTTEEGGKSNPWSSKTWGNPFCVRKVANSLTCSCHHPIRYGYPCVHVISVLSLVSDDTKVELLSGVSLFYEELSLSSCREKLLKSFDQSASSSSPTCRSSSCVSVEDFFDMACSSVSANHSSSPIIGKRRNYGTK